MKRADKILKSKHWLKDEIDKNFPQNESNWIWEDAHSRLERYQAEFADIPAGESVHAHEYIFPAAAVYLSLKEAAGEEAAFEIMTQASDRHSRKMIDMMKKLMHVPGAKDLFIKAWDPVSRKMFGPENGFRNKFYDTPKGEFRMDVTECPYNKYCTLIGCPEMIKMFCTNDDKMYGDLPGIEFLRTGTIGRGDECCDFYIRKEIKADYKNWVPEKMIAELAAATAAAAGLLAVARLLQSMKR